LSFRHARRVNDITPSSWTPPALASFGQLWPDLARSAAAATTLCPTPKHAKPGRRATTTPRPGALCHSSFAVHPGHLLCSSIQSPSLSPPAPGSNIQLAQDPYLACTPKHAFTLHLSLTLQHHSAHPLWQQQSTEGDSYDSGHRALACQTSCHPWHPSSYHVHDEPLTMTISFPSISSRRS
jgi:hypothetical protein